MSGEEISDLEELSRAACLDLLRGEEVGRLAVVVDGRPDVFPVNYALDASDSVILRTDLGTKLTAAVNHHVAFEVDGIRPGSRSGWSVVVHGTAHHTERVQPGPRDVDPWRDHTPYLVRIATSSISGRRIHWGHTRHPSAGGPPSPEESPPTEIYSKRPSSQNC